MRILCVAEEFPWPPITGYRVRLSNVLRSLSEVGDVDFFAALNDGRTPEPCVVPPDVRLDRVNVVSERPPKSKAARLARWCTSRLPLELLWRRWSRARREFRRWRRERYDLVWFSHVDGYLALGDLARGPSIIDLDNLEDERLRHRQTARHDDQASGRSNDRKRSFAHRFARRWIDPVDVSRWGHVQQRALASAQAVAVCSELDRERLDHPKVVVLPNGYEVPSGATATGERSARSTAVLTMVGVLRYEPNSDAAWWFADEILPIVRTGRPDAVFRVVGRPHELADGLDAREGVVMRGLVDDISAELAEADVSVVPLRSGGGTRVKILEAFAHHLPVVSTNVGCEGLGVVSGEHLLIADGAQEFADACLRLLDDDELRTRLTAAAFTLVGQHYDWRQLRPRVAALAARVATDAANESGKPPVSYGRPRSSRRRPRHRGRR